MMPSASGSAKTGRRERLKVKNGPSVPSLQEVADRVDTSQGDDWSRLFLAVITGHAEAQEHDCFGVSDHLAWDKQSKLGTSNVWPRKFENARCLPGLL